MYQSRAKSVTNNDSTITCTTIRRSRDLVFSTGRLPALGGFEATEQQEDERDHDGRERDVVEDRAGDDRERPAQGDTRVAEHETGQGEDRRADESPRRDGQDGADGARLTV